MQAWMCVGSYVGILFNFQFFNKLKSFLGWKFSSNSSKLTLTKLIIMQKHNSGSMSQLE